MNKDIIAGKWTQIKGQIKQKFGKLTDDDITQINGKRDVFVGRLQQRYGYAKDKAEEELTRYERSLGVSGSGRSDFESEESDIIEEKRNPRR